MPYCVKCGRQVPEGAAFCGACGAPVGGAGTTSAPAASENMSVPGSVPPPPPVQAQVPPPPPTPAAQASVPPPPPISAGQEVLPPPPPQPGSQPGSFRVQMVRQKVAGQPPHRDTTPPPSFVAQQQQKKSRSTSNGRKRSGSNLGGCLRRSIYWVTAGIALVTSLLWGVKSCTDSYNRGEGLASVLNGLLPEPLKGVITFGGGDGQNGGVVGKDSKVPNTLNQNEYEPIFAQGELIAKLDKEGWPQVYEDHGLCFGTYSPTTEMPGMQGHTVAFKIEPADGSDKRVVGKFTMLGDGSPVRSGMLCYGGMSIYAFYTEREERYIGNLNSTDMVVFAHDDGKSFGAFEKGEEKVTFKLEE